MKHAVEMGSGAMICIPSFVKIGSAIQKLAENTQTQKQYSYSICLRLFFQNKERKLKGDKCLEHFICFYLSHGGIRTINSRNINIYST
jgi:hypothetical protein